MPMFRFTIRDVLLVTALLAALVAWWIDHRVMRAKNEAIVAQSERLRWTLMEAHYAHKMARQDLYDALKHVRGNYSWYDTEPNWGVYNEPIDGSAPTPNRR
jgi:hypothetical protein